MTLRVNFAGVVFALAMGSNFDPALLGQSATAASPAKDSSDRVDALLAYNGTWKIETESFDTANSKAGKDSHTLINDCWKTGPWVACRQNVDGDDKALLVFTCPGSGKECVSYPIPVGGAQAGSGKLTIEGNTWIFPWTTSQDGKTMWFRVVNEWSSASSIEFRQEFSTDQTHWTRMTTGHEMKVGGGK